MGLIDRSDELLHGLFEQQDCWMIGALLEIDIFCRAECFGNPYPPWREAMPAS